MRRFWDAVKWWEYDWLFLTPMAFFGTAGIGIVTGSWLIWLLCFTAALLFCAVLPMFN